MQHSPARIPYSAPAHCVDHEIKFTFMHSINSSHRRIRDNLARTPAQHALLGAPFQNQQIFLALPFAHNGRAGWTDLRSHYHTLRSQLLQRKRACAHVGLENQCTGAAGKLGARSDSAMGGDAAEGKEAQLLDRESHIRKEAGPWTARYTTLFDDDKF